MWLILLIFLPSYFCSNIEKQSLYTKLVSVTYTHSIPTQHNEFVCFRGCDDDEKCIGYRYDHDKCHFFGCGGIKKSDEPQLEVAIKWLRNDLITKGLSAELKRDQAMEGIEEFCAVSTPTPTTPTTTTTVTSTTTTTQSTTTPSTTSTTTSIPSTTITVPTTTTTSTTTTTEPTTTTSTGTTTTTIPPKNKTGVYCGTGSCWTCDECSTQNRVGAAVASSESAEYHCKQTDPCVWKLCFNKLSNAIERDCSKAKVLGAYVATSPTCCGPASRKIMSCKEVVSGKYSYFSELNGKPVGCGEAVVEEAFWLWD